MNEYDNDNNLWIYSQNTTKWLAKKNQNVKSSICKAKYGLVKQYTDIIFDKYKFASCGESTTLNFVNYILLKDNKFVVPDFASEKVKNFYNNYPTMDSITNIKAVTDWADVIANHHNVSYAQNICELAPSFDSVTALMRKLFSDIPFIVNMTIIQIVNKIDPNIRITIEPQNPIDPKDPEKKIMILDECIKFVLAPGHGSSDSIINISSPNKIIHRLLGYALNSVVKSIKGMIFSAVPDQYRRFLWDDDHLKTLNKTPELARQLMNATFIWAAAEENMMETFEWLLNHEHFDISSVGTLFAYGTSTRLYSRKMFHDRYHLIMENRMDNRIDITIYIAKLLTITTSKTNAKENNIFIKNIYLIFLNLTNRKINYKAPDPHSWSTSIIETFLYTVNKNMLRASISNIENIMSEYNILFGEFEAGKEEVLQQHHIEFIKNIANAD